MVTIFGDSITGNRFGISYRRYLGEDYSYRGIDGQDSLTICRRAEAFLQRNGDDSEIVIQAGGNDILDICREWGCLIERKSEDPNTPYEAFQDWALRDAVRSHVVEFLEKDGFEGILAKVLERESMFVQALKKLKCKLRVVSVTVLTENKLSLFNRLAREWNTALRRDVKELFIDVYTPLLQMCSGNGVYLGGTVDELLSDKALIDGSEMNAENLAKERNLRATVDGIHLSPAGARVVATILSQSLAFKGKNY